MIGSHLIAVGAPVRTNRAVHILSLVTVFVALATGCQREPKQVFVASFAEFSANVASEGKAFSREQWRTADSLFDDFSQEQFALWSDDMSVSERDSVNVMVGRYRALQIRRGLTDFRKQVEDVVGQTRSMLETLTKDTTSSK